MQKAHEVITRFYTSFSQLNSGGMNDCYAEEIVFFDPVFEMLQGNEVRSMWEMLCRNAKDFSLSFSNITDLGDNYYTCDWVAEYTFSANGKKVINNVRANMKIENGFIIEHSDAYSLHKWAAQALGFSGRLLGWNSLYQRQIKNKAKGRLLEYMEGG